MATLSIVALIASSTISSAGVPERLETTPRIELEEAKLRLGLMMGEPAGLTLAIPFRPQLALHAAIGIPFGVADVSASTDLVFRLPELIGRIGRRAQAVVWFGLGGRWTHEPELDRFGLRVPFGLSVLTLDGTGELFFEVTPGLAISPDLRTLIEGGVGIRLRVF